MPTPTMLTAPVVAFTVATAVFELVYATAAVELVVAVGAVNAAPQVTVCVAVFIVITPTAGAIVMTTVFEVAAKKLPSVGLVAVMVQVPTPFALTVTTPPAIAIVHGSPTAVAYATTPVPEPPPVVRVVLAKGAALYVSAVDPAASVSGAWAAAATGNVNVIAVAARKFGPPAWFAVSTHAVVPLVMVTVAPAIVQPPAAVTVGTRPALDVAPTVMTEPKVCVPSATVAASQANV